MSDRESDSSNRPLRVLYLPVNIASNISLYTKGMRSLGINARGVARYPISVFQDFDGCELLPKPQRRRKPHLWLLTQYEKYFKIISAIAWADVVHWIGHIYLMPFALDVRIAQWLNKPRIVQFVGADIRNPEVEMVDNPMYARLVNRIGLDHPSFQRESRENSIKVQRLFGGAGFSCYTGHSLAPAVQKELWPKVYDSARLMLPVGEFEPHYPDPSNSRPLVVHTPSSPMVKGTPAVLAAVEKLQKRLSFDYKNIHGVTRQEALRITKVADIVIDQLIAGVHGLYALEAMALGKPIICYIKPSMINKYLSDLPIVNANEDNIEHVLEELIKNGELRHKLGKKGRAYVKRNHDVPVVAKYLLNIYKDLIARHHYKSVWK